MTALTRPLGYIALFYWFVFWLLNGLDKFMHGAAVSLGSRPLFTWHGKDRLEQFTKYFDRLDLPSEGILPLLSLCGLFELVVATLFAITLAGTRHYETWLGAAFTACATMFIGFSTWDVIVGDRAELLEHGTYLGVVFVTGAFVALTQFRPAGLRISTQNRRPGLGLTS
jgi:hypothetical protein